MRILMVGADSEYAIEIFYLKYFNEENDVVAELFQAQNIFLKYYKKNLFNKVLFRLGYRGIYNKINELLKSRILAFKPDIVFIFKGMEVYPKLIVWAKHRGIKFANYNPDNPFIFTGRGSGNKNVSNSIELYDFHFTYNHEVKVLIETKFHISTYMLPFGFDIELETLNFCQITKEVNKVCFIGNPDKSRANFLNELAIRGINIDVYGLNWKKFIKNKNISCYNTVYGIEFWKTLRKYRVQLNLMRIHNLDSHNMRSFEILGIGGIQLAPKTKEHQIFFEDNKEIFLYNNVIECVSKINYLLSLTTEQANKYRTFARESCIKNKYSYKDRVLQVIEILKKNRNDRNINC